MVRDFSQQGSPYRAERWGVDGLSDSGGIIPTRKESAQILEESAHLRESSFFRELVAERLRGTQSAEPKISAPDNPLNLPIDPPVETE